MTAEGRNFWVGVVGVVLAGASLGWAVYAERIPFKVSPQSQFICSLRPDTERGGEVWTVLYEKPGKQPKPWLKMVEEMGPDWDTESRCNEISDRMNLFKGSGLTAFEYQKDEKVTGQYIICARTQATQGCSLVVTLKTQDAMEAAAAWQEITDALIPGNPESYQSSAEMERELQTTIPLEEML